MAESNVTPASGVTGMREKDEKDFRSLTLPVTDVEVGDGVLEEKGQLRQGLHQRHIQMIALAGTIGTGLFLGSGKALSQAGPLGLLLGYSIVGMMVSSVVLAVGEMGALVPLSGGVVRYAEYFFDPAMSFANGWNQVYSYCVSVPAEIVASAVLVEFWTTGINNAIWITLSGVLMIATCILFVRIYGELEFTFAMLKTMLIVGINIMALVITCGGGPDHSSIGFRYWRNPGPFVQYLDMPGALGRFAGFWTTLNNALYAYAGIENITLPAAETKNPRRAIPAAAKRIFIRIILFYIITMFMVGLVVPSNDPALLSRHGTAASPFVIAATRAGIKVVPSIINGIILTSAWSSGNSALLGGSRILYGLAMEGHAPKVFKRINRFGIPWVAVGMYSLFMIFGYMTLSDSASTVFSWLQDLVSIATLVNWIIVCMTYLRFHYACKKQGINRHTDLPWAAPLQPYTTWFSLILFTTLLITGGYVTFIKGKWNTETFVSSYINIPFILMLYFGYKAYRKTLFKNTVIPLSEVPIRPFIRIWRANPEPSERPKKGLRKMNILWC